MSDFMTSSSSGARKPAAMYWVIISSLMLMRSTELSPEARMVVNLATRSSGLEGEVMASICTPEPSSIRASSSGHHLLVVSLVMRVMSASAVDANIASASIHTVRTFHILFMTGSPFGSNFARTLASTGSMPEWGTIENTILCGLPTIFCSF
jgi:hypothetical protein